MALPANRPISFQQIITEFNKGPYFSSYLGAAPGVPSSRPLYMASNFLGKSGVVDVTPDNIPFANFSESGNWLQTDISAYSNWYNITGTNTTIQLRFTTTTWSGTANRQFIVTTTNNSGGTSSGTINGNGQNMYINLIPGSSFRCQFRLYGMTGSGSFVGSADVSSYNESDGGVGLGSFYCQVNRNGLD